MISIGIFCIAIALIALQFKTIKQEYGVFISVAGCVFIFVYSMTKLSDIVDIMDRLSMLTSISKEYINTV